MDDYHRARQRMVQRDLRRRGIDDARVLDAMASLPRHVFVPLADRAHAYEDRALPLEVGQTISQPYMVACMTQALRLRPGDRVLEVGTGSGYQTAVLALLAAEVFTIERIGDLQGAAREVLDDLGIANVRYRIGDGTLGWPEHAPYDAIVATAGGPDVPAALLDQLALGGRLVMPVGPMFSGQRLVRVVRELGDYRREDLEPVAFVPLVGAQGWPEREGRR